MKMCPLPSHASAARPGPQSGFTLVELMISMVLGLFIVLALLTLLINVNRNNSEMTKANRVIENGRFSIQLLEHDISHAGFWAGYLPQFDDVTVSGMPTDVPRDEAGPPAVTAVPDPCADWGALAGNPAALAVYKSNLLGIAVQAYEVPAVVPSPTVPVCGSRVVSPQPSSDVLLVRHVETCAVGEAGCPAYANNELYFQMAQCGSAMPVPAYALEQYAAATVDTLLPHRVRSANCAAGAFAPRHKFVSSLYYVRRFAVTDGDNIPTLMRSDFSCASGTCGFGAAQAMIEGIESFRVELGIDNVSDSGATIGTTTFNTSAAGVTIAGPTDVESGPTTVVIASGQAATVTWANPTTLTSPTNRGDGIPDTYRRCTTASPCSALELMNAVSLKLYVLARSESTSSGHTDTKTYCMTGTCASADDRIGPFNDGYKRHLFTQAIRLVNISNRRETP